MLCPNFHLLEFPFYLLEQQMLYYGSEHLSTSYQLRHVYFRLDYVSLLAQSSLDLSLPNIAQTPLEKDRES